jgi:hypothetical protein
VTMDFDTSAHSICYSFKPVVENLAVEPNHLCVGPGDEATQPIKLRFSSGASYDISDVYNPNMTRQYYDLYMQKCLAGPHV